MEEPPRPAPKRQITLKLPGLPSAPATLNCSAITPSGTTPGSATTPQTPSQGPPKIKLIRKSLPSTPATEGAPAHIQNHMPPPPPPAGVAPANSSDPAPNVADMLSMKPVSPTQPKKPRTKLKTIPDPKITKTGRVMKLPKKLTQDVVDSDEDVPLSQTQHSSGGHPTKKIKLMTTPVTPRVPTLKLKSRGSGKAPYHPPGEGYDSEAEDREIDPVIESQIILRMPPGEHCEYVRQMINEKKIGAGADIKVKWLDDDGRRCMVTVKGQPFAAVLVDLPTITESMKTWDKKAMVKSADICQMLLVFAPVKSEEEALKETLPKPVDHGYRWPHGLTPPMHDCRNRRFRKRLSKLEIQNKEAEVERLLNADKAAISTTIEWVEETEDEGEDDADGVEEFEEDEDADGEIDDYFGDAEIDQHQDEDTQMDINEDELEAQMEAEFHAAFEEMDENGGDDMVPSAAGVDALTPMTAQTATPAESAAEAGGANGVEDSGDDEEDDDEEMDDGDVDGDEDDDNHGQTASIRAEIANLKKQLAKAEHEFETIKAPILKRRLEQQIRNIKSEIDLKKSSIGEFEED